MVPALATFAWIAAGVASGAAPAVLLSAEHQAMCRVGVGDAFPELSARTASGEIAELPQLGGERATVIATPGGPAWMRDSLESDLAGVIVPQYGDRGVKVYALADVAGAGAAIPTLSVGEATLAERLGEGRGPRVYVLSPEGSVVWFDLEYTQSTYRELRATLDELTAD